MRKLLWCCSAAGLLASAAMFSATYYACRHPESLPARCITTVAGTSVVMRPVAGVASAVARATQHVLDTQEPASTPGSAEECVPEEPRPIEPEPMPEPAEAGVIGMHLEDRHVEAAPIVIREEEPVPPAEGAEPVPATIDMDGMRMPGDAACPMVMPYCTDDEEEVAPKPSMPYADDGEPKQADGSGESDDDARRAWLKLFEGAGKEEKPAGEELPAPTEDVSDAPKCQEDCHRHEHCSGCPRVTCPYTGKSYPACEPATRPGKEEPSEEPMPKPTKHGKKHGKGKDECPRTEGVDTMEYRPSDGGLNEYGPGPLH